MLVDGMIPTFGEYESLGTEAYANQTLRIPLELHYEQTAALVTPGPANTVATVTLAYK